MGTYLALGGDQGCQIRVIQRGRSCLNCLRFSERFQQYLHLPYTQKHTMRDLGYVSDCIYKGPENYHFYFHLVRSSVSWHLGVGEQLKSAGGDTVFRKYCTRFCSLVILAILSVGFKGL